MDWVEFLQRAFNKSGVTVQPEHPVFVQGEKGLGGIIQFIESSDPRVLGQYSLFTSAQQNHSNWGTIKHGHSFFYVQQKF
jgi:hypothetical protein